MDAKGEGEPRMSVVECSLITIKGQLFLRNRQFFICFKIVTVVKVKCVHMLPNVLRRYVDFSV